MAKWDDFLLGFWGYDKQLAHELAAIEQQRASLKNPCQVREDDELQRWRQALTPGCIYSSLAVSRLHFISKNYYIPASHCGTMEVTFIQRPKTKDQRPKTKDQRPKTKFS